MAKNKIIDIDAEFDSVTFDEAAINHATAMVKRNQDPAYNLKRNTAVRKVMDTEQWQVANSDAVKRWSNDPKWIKEQQERHERRNANPIWQENVKKAAKEKSKPCITPLGVFQSVHAAGNYYDQQRGTQCGKTVTCRNLKKGTQGYQYITVEEYIMITGKDIV